MWTIDFPDMPRTKEFINTFCIIRIIITRFGFLHKEGDLMTRIYEIQSHSIHGVFECFMLIYRQ